MGDRVWELAGEEADQAVGLLHVAGDFGEVAIGGHADGAAKRFADVVPDSLLDGERDLAGGRRVALAAEELADHLVDGRRVGDRADALYRCDNFVGIFRVRGVVSVDKDDIRADAFGLADAGTGLNAEGFGLVAGGNERGGVGHGGDDAGGLVAVLGMELLLHRREEAIEIDVEEGEEVGLSGGAHERIIFASCSPAAAVPVKERIRG